MGYRRPDGADPPEDSYSRVTEPERFAAVVEAADVLVTRLVETYDVMATPTGLDGAVRARRLVPREGAPLVLGVTPFPGVVLTAGTWATPSRFPECGCDACDESGQDAVDRLLEEIGAVVHGGFRERLTRRELTCSWEHEDLRRSSTAPLSRAKHQELAALAPAGDHAWPAWPVRTAPVTPAT